MNANSLNSDDWFVAYMPVCCGDPEENLGKPMCVLERLGTGDIVEASASEIAALIKAERVFWKI